MREEARRSVSWKRLGPCNAMEFLRRGPIDRLSDFVAGSRPARLLSCQIDREFSIADAQRQSLGKTRGRFLSVGGDEFSEGGEQASLCQAIAVDPIEARFGPGLSQIAQRCALVLVVPMRLHRQPCVNG